MKSYQICGLIFAALSILTFILYVVDKIKAVNGKWRIPEKTLLFFSFFGGGVGGYLAMFIARHKTRKLYFHIVNVAGIILQIAIIVALAIFAK